MWSTAFSNFLLKRILLLFTTLIEPVYFLILFCLNYYIFLFLFFFCARKSLFNLLLLSSPYEACDEGTLSLSPPDPKLA